MFKFSVRLAAIASGAVAVNLACFCLALTFVSAKASEPSYSCCHDLDARVAELEAAALRKSSRLLSVQLYGQVNRAILIWDDGEYSDAYVVDNDTSSTRLGLIGEPMIEPGWYAGYRMEFEFPNPSSDEVFEGPASDEGEPGDDLHIRHSYWYVEADKYGRFAVGQQSPASDDITIINLGAKMSDAALHYNNSFGLRLNMGGGVKTDLTWGDFAYNIDSLRGDFVRYDTPAFYGFILSAAAGEDDVWDVALRYHADWDSLKFAAGVGYMDSGELDHEDVRGSASAIHKDTGFFLSAAGGYRQDHAEIATNGDDAHFYFAQLGVKRQFTPLGATTFYGELGVYKDYTVGSVLQAELYGSGNYGAWGKVIDSEVQRWGVGVEQSLDDSALLLYAQFHRYEADLVGMPCADGCSSWAEDVQTLPTEPWSAVVLGARVQF